MASGIPEATRAVRTLQRPTNHFGPILLFRIERDDGSKFVLLFGEAEVEIKFLVDREWSNAFEDGMAGSCGNHLEFLRLDFRKPFVWSIAGLVIKIAADPFQKFVAGVLARDDQAVMKENDADTAIHDLIEILHATEH